jgi:hypothetical protein
MVRNFHSRWETIDGRHTMFSNFEVNRKLKAKYSGTLRAGAPY